MPRAKKTKLQPFRFFLAIQGGTSLDKFVAMNASNTTTSEREAKRISFVRGGEIYELFVINKLTFQKDGTIKRVPIG